MADFELLAYLGIGICVALILWSFINLTWEFWEGMIAIGGMAGENLE